jgi:hypothetical protein
MLFEDKELLAIFAPEFDLFAPTQGKRFAVRTPNYAREPLAVLEGHQLPAIFAPEFDWFIATR